MDACVDDFLNEINEIVPTKHKELSCNKNSCDWEECFDDTSGFSYYWNINTNEVTWEIPSEFKKWKSLQKKPKHPKATEKHQIYKPESQVFPMVPVSHIPDTIIYKIGDTITTKTMNKPVETNEINKLKIDKIEVVHTSKTIINKNTLKGHSKPKDDSDEDEKITLISSYGGDTESEDDENGENEEDLIQSKVIVPTKEFNCNKSTANSSSNDELTDQQHKVTGITLLASYGESDDEEDINKGKNNSKLDTPPKISTLFPIQQVIDASQFDSSSSQRVSSVAKMIVSSGSSTSSEEQKVYQRKRRIGLELPSSMVTKKSEKSIDITNSEEQLEGSRTGFGFDPSTSEKYSNFKSSGKVTFIKSDSDVPLPSNFINSSDNADLLKEKLNFLCEGKQVDVSPVQIMLIQLETLQTAKLSRCLQPTYLNKWLQETNEEISKLEKDSTPKGWLLDWDRRQKRYSYRHLHSGHIQWDYPTTNEQMVEEPLEEDMDICTTPPPPLVLTLTTPTSSTTLETQPKEQQQLEDTSLLSNVDFTKHSTVAQPEVDTVEIVAPPPPKIGRMDCPIPPPPPTLTEEDMVTPPLPLMPEESPPPPPPPEEPLPPGIDIPTTNKHKNNVPPENLNTALDSFYSDIAAMESTIITNNVPEDTQKSETPSITNAADVIPVEAVKKRKKLKMSQGLSMKKKEVSKLVEKWKIVQKTLD